MNDISSVLHGPLRGQTLRNVINDACLWLGPLIRQASSSHLSKELITRLNELKILLGQAIDYLNPDHLQAPALPNIERVAVEFRFQAILLVSLDGHRGAEVAHTTQEELQEHGTTLWKSAAKLVSEGLRVHIPLDPETVRHPYLRDIPLAGG